MRFVPTLTDLMPPAFAEGLDDWSRGDGTPDSPTYDGSEVARLVEDQAFGICLELRIVDPVQRLRYMGELPVPAGAFLEISARLVAVCGPLPDVRVAGWPGGAHGRRVDGLPAAGPLVAVPALGTTVGLRAVIGPEPVAGVDMVWSSRVLYAHLGLDLIGGRGAVVRIENLAVREVTADFAQGGRVLPGFGPRPVRS